MERYQIPLKPGAIALALFALILVSLTLTFCSDNDDSSDDNSDDCPELVSQEAQGNFRGTDFVNQGGFYKEQTFGGNTTYRCEIYVKEATGGDCFFPEFEAPRDIILFSIFTFVRKPKMLVKIGVLVKTGGSFTSSTVILND